MRLRSSARTKQLTYAELNSRGNQLAHYLCGLGVGAEAIVGLCVERSLEMIIGILGILKAGGAYLPLDPSYPGERLAYMIEDAGPLLVLTQERLRERLPAALKTFFLDKEWEMPAGAIVNIPAVAVTAQNLAYVIYTSGSTGRPKGVGVSHRNAGRLFAATEAEYSFSSDGCLGAVSFLCLRFFCLGDIWSAPLRGTIGHRSILDQPFARSVP